MASTMIESALFERNFGDRQMREVFSDESLVRNLLRVEAALANAEARVGLIPEDAAKEISRRALQGEFPLDQLRKGIESAGHVMVPLVRALAAACEGDAGGYAHWGTTTQDVYDTACVLRYKDAFELVLERLYSLRGHLAVLAEREADTLMAGRTNGQHALPITFGYKVAVWCWEVHRQVERWEQAKPRILVGNITGAVGTFAGFGERGPEVQRLALGELGLGVPEICWHTARDRSAEMASLLVLAAGTVEKIAGEVYRLQSTEYGEVEEPFFAGKVGSSTMPHKRNPSLCFAVITATKAVRGEASMVFEAMAQEHERHSGIWRTEWVGLPNGFILLSGALAKLDQIVAGLKVNRGRMERNLELLRGAIMSEALMLELGKHVGRQRAHDLVYEASMRAFERDRSLRECLLEVPEVQEYLSEAELDRVFDYRSYLGLASELAREPAAAFLKG